MQTTTTSPARAACPMPPRDLSGPWADLCATEGLDGIAAALSDYLRTAQPGGDL